MLVKQHPQWRFNPYAPVSKQITYSIRTRKHSVFHYTFNLEIYIKTDMYLHSCRVMKKVILIFTEQWNPGFYRIGFHYPPLMSSISLVSPSIPVWLIPVSCLTDSSVSGTPIVPSASFLHFNKKLLACQLHAVKKPKKVTLSFKLCQRRLLIWSSPSCCYLSWNLPELNISNIFIFSSFPLPIQDGVGQWVTEESRWKLLLPKPYSLRQQSSSLHKRQEQMLNAS